MDFREKFKLINTLINYSNKERYDEDVFSLHLIQSILHRPYFIPLNAMALRPFALAFIVNEIVINKRKNVLEFGSGMSTILWARLVWQLKLDVTITSVDENISWLNFISSKLKDEGLQDIVNLIHAPLKLKSIDAQQSNHWYDDTCLRSIDFDKMFDLVIVDGPTAFVPEIQLSRYFAIPFIKDRLDSRFVIFLDDANRDGEKLVMDLWRTEFSYDFAVYGNTLGVHYHGDYFESNPIRYVSKK